MIETAGYGFSIGTSIVPYRTLNLERIERTTDTEIHTYSDTIHEVTGKPYFVPLSEQGLNRKWTGVDWKEEPEDENIFDSVYNPLEEKFSKRIIESIENLSEEYGEVFLYPYMNTHSLGSEELERKLNADFELIAPEMEIVEELKNKAKVYKNLKKRDMNLIEGEVVDGPEEACELIVEKDWENGAFVTEDSGAGGSGCVHAFKPEDIRKRFQDEYFSGNLIVEEFVDVEKAPNSLIFVDEERPYLLSVTNQIIENETEYSGNVKDDSIFNKEEMASIEKESLRAGEYMREKGFLGLAGIDLITTEEDVYFVEINPRKNHSTVINNQMLEMTRPEEIPPLPYLETEILLGEGDNYPIGEWESPDLNWHMYVLKDQEWSRINKLPPRSDTRDHEWNFKGAYTADIPYPIGSLTHKSYASQKSEGHTRRIEPTQRVRIVSDSLNQRLKMISKVENCFSSLGD